MITALKQFSIFSKFDETELFIISKFLIKRRFQPHEEVNCLVRGKRSLFLILEGAMLVYNKTKIAHQIGVQKYQPGQIVGIESAYNGTIQLRGMALTKGTYIELSDDHLNKISAVNRLLGEKLEAAIAGSDAINPEAMSA